ncbi:AraC family transcriptional regulator [Sinorhizobium numidicum]|uniref:AraC family transcriptional regulator n=1 Tax=Sinorhizobium numidicum TaxID=680248 RepID=A0ABY8CQG0_9HYPH|nr:AraC family transcriptional regulator [Sinorhizobium numidicum]WEX74866.1 AraC family transcriptional regulator [Sinorhizobium numidicum]WEX80859.1 AraC family transcriptional regulator [Sinorhizobium numidicum]
MSFKPLLGDGRIRAREEETAPLQTASWIGSSVVFDSRRWVCQEAELRWTAPHHLVVLTDGGSTSRTSIRTEGKALYEGQDRPGVLTFVPAGAERVGFYRDVDLSYSALWIDPELALPGLERLRDIPILVNRSDTVIGTLLTALCTEMSLGHLPDTVYVEHLVALVGLRMASLEGNPRPAASQGRLGRRAFERVRDYIDAHVASDISLSEVAAIAGMPVDTFARRFKETTGRPPYAYILEERVRRAELLLSDTSTAIGAIAFRLGFSSQSHFTATFRRLKGITPRAYRLQFSPES